MLKLLILTLLCVHITFAVNVKPIADNEKKPNVIIMHVDNMVNETSKKKFSC